jgi:hypothetical protein
MPDEWKCTNRLANGCMDMFEFALLLDHSNYVRLE